MSDMSVIKHEQQCDCRDLSVEVIDSLRTKGVKKSRKVLDEDKYVDTIDRIIERDFFPDLAKLKAQIDYRNAVEANDFAAIKFLENKFRATNRPQTGLRFCSEPNTPSTFETPLRTGDNQSNENEINSSNADDCKSKQTECCDGEASKDMRLDQFLNKYTSEDNASFEQLHEEEMKKHEVKYPWLYKDVDEHNKSVNDLLALPSIEKQAIDCEKPSSGLITWKYTNQNSVMSNPDGAPFTADEIMKNVKQQKVVHENTRFKVMPFNESLNKRAIASAAHLQAKQKEGKIGVDGKELVPKDTPVINGFKLVEMTPSPRPGVSDSPFMTWGEIEGTPFSLDGSDTPLHPSVTPSSSQFKIPDIPQRDKIGLSLANKAAKHHRDKKKTAIQNVQSSLPVSSPSFSSPKTPLERLNSMSPAAQKLATIKLGLHKNSDQTLLASYSPARSTPLTPNRTPDSTPSPSPNSPSTPLLRKDCINNKRNTEKLSLSEKSMLKPKRKKAFEFF